MLTFKDINKQNKKLLGYILVVTTAINVQIYLAFDGLEKQLDKKLIIVTPEEMLANPAVLLSSRAVIIIRDLYFKNLYQIFKISHQLKIPCYFYTDDNRPLMAELTGSEPSFYLPLYFASTLKKFQGVLLSSDNMLTYFNKVFPDNKNYLFPLIMRKELLLKEYRENEIFTFSFMSATTVRVESFCSVIIPILCSLSSKYKFRLVCPITLEKAIATNWPTLPFKIIYIPFILDYNKFIEAYQIYRPNIMIHIIDMNHANTRYKTLNSLTNATLCGSVLMTTDEEPYSGAPNGTIALVPIDGKDKESENWKNTIIYYLNNHQLLQEMRERALRYCTETFNGKQNEKVLNMILDAHEINENIIQQRKELYGKIDKNLTLREKIAHTIFFDVKRMYIITKTQGIRELLKVAKRHIIR